MDPKRSPVPRSSAVGLAGLTGLAAYARVEDRLRVLSTGFQMHVPKPVEPSELVTIVASVADQQSFRRP